MKPFILFAIGLWVNLHAQTQSQDWIDLSNRSDAEIISMLEKAVAALAESPAEEASNRVYILQMQEKTARQSFDQKTILLEGELTAAAAAKEAAEKAFSTYFIRNSNDPSLLSLPPSIQEEIRAMLIAAERANVEVRNNLNILVQQEMQVLRSSGVADSKDLLKSKSDALKRQMDGKRLDLFANRQAYASARKKFWDHLNSAQRIEIVTQSDLERNRSQDVIKTKLMRECLTQFRTTAKSLFSQENSKVVNFQLVDNSSKSMFRQVQLQAAKVLGIYLSPSEGDIKYTAAVAFRFGFEYTSLTQAAANVTTNVTKFNLSFLPDQPTTNVTTNIIRPNSLQRFRSYPTTLSVEQVKTKVRQYGFYDDAYNPRGKGINNNFELQQSGQVVFDYATGLMWQQSGSSEHMTYADAENYIRDLNNRRFASYIDWRLPTLEEAMSLMEPKKHGNLHLDPMFDREAPFIWTVDKENAGAAWVVGFNFGGCGHYDIGISTNHVRAVR